jgi:hypothetical protein
VCVFVLNVGYPVSHVSLSNAVLGALAQGLSQLIALRQHRCKDITHRNHTDIPKHLPCKIFVRSYVTVVGYCNNCNEGEQDSLCTYNVTLRRVRANIVTVYKQ